MVLLGTSGAGKTFTMQLMALRLREKNIQTFILAPLKGHEFRRACHNIGGEFIQISPASKNCINIMEIRKNNKIAEDVIDGERTERSELSAKIQRLHIFFSLLIPDMTHEERQLLDEALIQTYAGKGITHQNESLYDEMGSYKTMPVCLLSLSELSGFRKPGEFPLRVSYYIPYTMFPLRCIAFGCSKVYSISIKFPSVLEYFCCFSWT